MNYAGNVTWGAVGWTCQNSAQIQSVLLLRVEEGAPVVFEPQPGDLCHHEVQYLQSLARLGCQRWTLREKYMLVVVVVKEGRGRKRNILAGGMEEEKRNEKDLRGMRKT